MGCGDAVVSFGGRDPYVPSRRETRVVAQAFYWTGVLHKLHATRSPERAQAACTALLRAFEAGCPLAAYDLGELYAAVGGGVEIKFEQVSSRWRKAAEKI